MSDQDERSDHGDDHVKCLMSGLEVREQNKKKKAKSKEDSGRKSGILINGQVGRMDRIRKRVHHRNDLPLLNLCRVSPAMTFNVIDIVQMDSYS